MGAYSGPDINENGLVLALDAANRKNYNLTAVEVLVVAGGGGGGAGTAGGGGGGGLIYNNNFAVTPGSALTVTVGAGGSGKVYSVSNSAGDNGGNSVFGSLTAIGGGGGGNRDSGEVGKNGGSGGGGGGSEGGINGAGTGTSGQGFAGGVGRGGGGGSAGGGGGGAGGVGQASPSTGLGGNGGPGLGFDISGTFTYYGGGGGGGSHTGRSSGGIGGGGAGSQNGPTYNAVAGTTNTGGGGGGGGGAAGGQYGGNGGSGIVIVRYPGPQKAIGGTVTSVGGYIIHTFTTTGSTTFTPVSATNNSAILGLSDFSDNNRFATSVNGTTYSASNLGYLSFDGSNDYITTGFTRGTLGNYLSISVWYKYLGTSGRTYSAIIGGKESGAGTEFFIGKNTGNTNIGIQDGNYNSSFVTGSNAFDGNWHQLVYTYDNGTGKIYLDSVLKNTGSFTKCNDAEEIVIGGEIEGSGYHFEGHISSVSFHNRVLTENEIKQNYNALKGRFVPDGSSVDKAAASAKQILEYNPAAQSGIYYIKWDGVNAYPIYCEMSLAGGGWMMILNYVHLGGTNPSLLVRNNSFPHLNSEYTLGGDESGSTSTIDGTWGHIGNALANSNNWTEYMFYGKTSFHNRIIHFTGNNTNIVNYIKTGSGSMVPHYADTSTNFNAELYNNASLPLFINSDQSGFSNQGNFAMTEFPIYGNSTIGNPRSHWGIRGLGDRWEVDDYPVSQGGTSSGNNTIHRIWVR